MSSSNGTPPVDASQANGLDAGEKPRLTEEEKKQNHIASGTVTLLSPPSNPHVLTHTMQNKNAGRRYEKASTACASWCRA